MTLWLETVMNLSKERFLIYQFRILHDAVYIVGSSDHLFRKTLCLVNNRPHDLLSHQPTLWFRLLFINHAIFLGHTVPQSLWIVSLDLRARLGAAHKLRVSGVEFLFVQFPLHASSSICICLV